MFFPGYYGRAYERLKGDKMNAEMRRILTYPAGTEVHVTTKDHRMFDNAEVISDDGLDLTILATDGIHPLYIKINWAEVWYLCDQAEWELESELAQPRQVEEDGEDDDR
jgi:hypothetical protein